MKRIFTLLSFITIVLLSSCSTLTGNTSGYTASKKTVKPNSPAATNFMLVANKPVTKTNNADADWVATSNPHVVAATSRRAQVDAVALSAATTVKGHEILKRKIERSMKTSMDVSSKSKKPKPVKATPKTGSGITL